VGRPTREPTPSASEVYDGRRRLAPPVVLGQGQARLHGRRDRLRRDEQYYRGRYDAAIANRTDAPGSAGGSGAETYARARPAYRLGHEAGLRADANQAFDDVEPELRQGYESYAGTNAGPAWGDVRGHVADAYGRGQERRLVLSEEQLTVGKRQVSAGEVELHTTVESERVRQQVQLAHDEVSIERRPLSAADAAGADLTIQEESIRVPLTREEAVVDKRVVPVEEVVVRTNTVTENQTVEDTVRRERLVTEGLDQQRGVSNAGGRGWAGPGWRAGRARPTARPTRGCSTGRPTSSTT
jgi:uncharacterized protein (TIGR02271 family)